MTLAKAFSVSLRLYAFIYDKLIEFPESELVYDTITKDIFLEMSTE